MWQQQELNLKNRYSIAGAVPAGTLFVLLLVTLCVLVPVLVRRAKKRRKTALLALEQTNTTTEDTYTEIPTKIVEHELQNNVAYVPTDIPTAANAAYLSTGREVTSTLNDEYAYAVVPDTGPESTDHQELKQNVVCIPTDIPTTNNAAYLCTRKDESIPEDYDYVVN